MSKMAFPQAGVITSLDTGKALAKVFLPLFKIETGWVKVAANLLYEASVSMEEPALTADPPGTIERPAPDPAINFISITAQAGTASRMTWGSLQVGDEVAVIFLNGDLNEGRVIARF